MKQALFLFFVAAASAGCSETSPAGKRSAECYVRYLKPESQLSAEVVLREIPPGQSEPQPYTPPGGVRFGGSLMRELVLQGAPVYRLEQGGGYTPEHEFTWSDDQKQKHTIGMNLPAITAFTFSVAPLSRKKPATCTWTGAPLEKKEMLVFMWERTSDRKTVPMEILGTPGQQSIEFPAAQLAKLEAGDWKLYLVRKKTSDFEAQGFSARCTAEYYSDVDTLTVTDL